MAHPLVPTDKEDEKHWISLLCCDVLCEARNVSHYPDSYLRSLLLAELLTIMDEGHSSC